MQLKRRRRSLVVGGAHDARVERCTIGVRVAGPLGLCDLHAWGRAPDGWWALVGWHDGGVRHPAGYRAAVYCTGWVPGARVTRWSGQTSSARVLRVWLDGLTWPPVNPRDGWHHFGLLDVDATPPLPPGYERIDFRATR